MSLAHASSPDKAMSSPRVAVIIPLTAAWCNRFVGQVTPRLPGVPKASSDFHLQAVDSMKRRGKLLLVRGLSQADEFEHVFVILAAQVAIWADHAVEQAFQTVKDFFRFLENSLKVWNCQLRPLIQFLWVCYSGHI
jgi:hypothetical protein